MDLRRQNIVFKWHDDTVFVRIRKGKFWLTRANARQNL